MLQIFFALTLLMLAPIARAQQAPHVGYVYPAGGQQGTTVQVAVGGQNLDGVTEAVVSGKGVKATLIEFDKPLTPGQFTLLRLQLKELVDKKAAAAAPATRPASAPASAPATRPIFTAEDEKRIEEIRKKLQNPPKKNGTPAIAETVMLRLIIDPTAEPGPRELCLETANGLTNPLTIYVGQLPEFTEKELEGTLLKPTPAVTLPAVFNGQILPGGADRFRFKAAKGQRIVVAAAARALIPYISDAVPCWFQATIALYDASGKEVAYADDYRNSPDPVLCFEIPRDGEYAVEIRDSLYRGREDFVYRLTVGQLPFITGVYPLGGKAGSAISVELAGWNLPATHMTLDLTKKPVGTTSLAAVNGRYSSNRVPLAVDNLPEIAEQEPNNSREFAQTITLPVIINGRIDKPGDVDVFKFEGRAGDELVAEVTARRLGSPLDSYLKLTDANDKQIAFNDDTDDAADGLETHHADSLIHITLPAAGTYYLALGDVQHKGGPEYAYRLRISRATPDFSLRVTPSSLGVRAGANAPITVYALRQDGFAGDIALTLKDAPAGFTLSGAKIPAGQDKVKLTLKAPPAPSEEPFTLALEGKATIRSQAVSHNAVPAEDMEQAFIYHHLVCEDQWLVDVLPRRLGRNEMKVVTATPLKLQPGRNFPLLVTLPATPLMGKQEFELADPPDGIAIQGVSSGRDGTEILISCDPSKIKPGLKGNLIINVFAFRQPPATGPAPVIPNRRRVQLGSMPAIPFEVVAQ